MARAPAASRAGAGVARRGRAARAPAKGGRGPAVHQHAGAARARQGDAHRARGPPLAQHLCRPPPPFGARRQEPRRLFALVALQQHQLQAGREAAALMVRAAVARPRGSLAAAGVHRLCHLAPGAAAAVENFRQKDQGCAGPEGELRPRQLPLLCTAPLLVRRPPHSRPPPQAASSSPTTRPRSRRPRAPSTCATCCSPPRRPPSGST